MALLYLSRYHRPQVWLPAIRQHLPDLEVFIWPEVPDPARVIFALCWAPPPGELRKYPNLRGVSSFGAGVEHILADPELPDIPICRIVDRLLTTGMTEYVVLSVLRHHRQLDRMLENQRAGRWQWFEPADTPNTTVGIMGLGELGRDAAMTLARFGFRIAGWSRTPKAVEGVDCHHGPAGLPAFLASCDYLVCLLPLTAETRGIINRETLAALPRGAYVINAGRGGHVVDEDLLAAIQSGHLDGATLDVFHREPLDPAHPFWTHPKITVTPHNASDSIPASVSVQMADNIRRAYAGQQLLNVVDRSRGY